MRERKRRLENRRRPFRKQANMVSKNIPHTQPRYTIQLYYTLLVVIYFLTHSAYILFFYVSFSCFTLNFITRKKALIQPLPSLHIKKVQATQNSVPLCLFITHRPKFAPLCLIVTQTFTPLCLIVTQTFDVMIVVTTFSHILAGVLLWGFVLESFRMPLVMILAIINY